MNKFINAVGLMALMAVISPTARRAVAVPSHARGAQDARRQADPDRAGAANRRRQARSVRPVGEHLDDSVPEADAGSLTHDRRAPVATFANVGAGFKEGLPLQPWAADVLKKRHEENSKDNPDAVCLPMGLMQFHLHPQPRKIIQTPTLIVILYEGNAGIRQIYMDGRRAPNNDPQPWWYGYSVGRWDGDTLVVETTNFRDGGWLDIWGSPLTDAAKMTERYRRVNFGVLEIDVTIDDPKAYTKPFTVRVDQRIMVDTEMIEFICNENNIDPMHMVGK